MKLKNILLLTACLAVGLSASIANSRPFGYAYNANGQLFSFDLTNPSSVVPIGDPSGTLIKGMDVRPGTTTLYCIDLDPVALTMQVFTINPTTGVRSPLGAAVPTTGTVAAVPYTINPNAEGYGFNFNPTTLQGDGSSRFRFVDSDGNNLRFNSSTGAISTVDGVIAYTDGTPAALVGAASYNNSDAERAGPALAPTSLYYLDAANDTLAISGNPNAGEIQNAGALGIDINAVAGMEIYSPPGNVEAGGGSNFAYVVTTVDNGVTYQLQSIANIGVSASPVSASYGTFPPGYEPVNGFAIIDFEEVTPPAITTGYGYNADGQLFSFRLNDPSTVTPIGPAGQTDVKGLDFRPGTLDLYSISVGSSTSQLSTVNLANGEVTPAPMTFDNVSATPAPYSISPGANFGFDFNPTTLQVDGSIRVRLVDDQGTNLRLNSATGTVASVDGAINIGMATETGVTGAGYTNSDTQRANGTTTPTRLYYLDADQDRLLTSPAANSGTSEVVGDLGLNVGPNTAFDVYSFNNYNIAYLVADPGNTGIYTLHTVDLQTGAASPAIGTFPTGFAPVNGFAIAAIPDAIRPQVTSRNVKRVKKVSGKRRSFTLRGFATDNVAVSSVQVKLKGKPFRRASGTDRWSRSIPLSSGRNTVAFYAVDTAGNRSQTERAVIIRRR